MSQEFDEKKKKKKEIGEFYKIPKLNLDFTNGFESEFIEGQFEEIQMPKVIKFSEFLIKSEVSLETPLIIKEQATESKKILKQIKVIEYPFERYIIKVGLSPENEFLGITEVKVNKDFRSIENRLRNVKVHNLEEYNIEE